METRLVQLMGRPERYEVRRRSDDKVLGIVGKRIESYSGMGLGTYTYWRLYDADERRLGDHSYSRRRDAVAALVALAE